MFGCDETDPQGHNGALEAVIVAIDAGKAATVHRSRPVLWSFRGTRGMPARRHSVGGFWAKRVPVQNL